MKNLVDECLSELGKALSSFGTYSFDDKGAHEVMSLEPLEEKLRAMSAEDASIVLLAVSKSDRYDGRGDALACTLVSNMQDWDELMEIEEINNMDW